MTTGAERVRQQLDRMARRHDASQMCDFAITNFDLHYDARLRAVQAKGALFQTKLVRNGGNCEIVAVWMVAISILDARGTVDLPFSNGWHRQRRGAIVFG